MVEKPDNWLFDNRWFGFQTISEKWQKLTGLTCFWLAKWSVILSWILFELYEFIYNSISFWDGIFSFVIVVIVLSVEYKGKDAINNLSNGYMNYDRINPILKSIRLVYTLFLFIALFLLVIVQPIQASVIQQVIPPTFSFLTLSFFYFSACTPLPPSKSRIRKMWEKAHTAVNGWLEPTPQPSES